MIAAIGQKNEIGLDNKLLWNSKSELEHFKQLTLGKPIIMGRKTFESLPDILPGREHIVITSDAFKHGVESCGDLGVAIFVPSLEEALSMCSDYGDDEVLIIGGASIYEQALPLADELHISHIDWTGEADTFFPVIDRSVWKLLHSPYGEAIVSDGPKWLYSKYVRKPVGWSGSLHRPQNYGEPINHSYL